MLRRPTIRDLSLAAGASISTVNCVIKGSAAVRKSTVERVLHATEATSFCGLGAIERSAANRRERLRLGVLRQQPGRRFKAGRAGVDMGNHMVCPDFAVYTPEIV